MLNRIGSTPVADGDTLYFNSGGATYRGLEFEGTVRMGYGVSFYGNYTINSADLKPVWQQQIAVGGDCPTCGDGSISSGAFANGVLYFAGGNKVSCPATACQRPSR